MKNISINVSFDVYDNNYLFSSSQSLQSINIQTQYKHHNIKEIFQCSDEIIQEYGTNFFLCISEIGEILFFGHVTNKLEKIWKNYIFKWLIFQKLRKAFFSIFFKAVI